jgi:replicative DNA helicase
VHGEHVITPLEAVDALNAWQSSRAPRRSTSLSEIDRVTGGFIPGRVWIITGTPGQGRTTLAIQWALLLAAQHGLRTDLVSVKEPEHLVAVRLLGSVGKIPVSHLWENETTSEDEPKLRRAREMLAEAPMRIAGPKRASVLTSEPPNADVPQALVIDDADLAAGAFPQRLAGFAAQGVLVIVTLPRHQVMDPDGVKPVWAQVADHIVDIDRPDLLDPHSLRPGEADLHLHRNRWGPQLTVAAAFQGHYARFVEMMAA